MKKYLLVIFIVLLLFGGCANTGAQVSQELKDELAEKYPPYRFQRNALVDMRYPTLVEMIKRSESGVSFIVADKITPLEPISFIYHDTKDDEGVKAIKDKIDSQGIAPGGDIVIIPYEIKLSESHVEDMGGKVIMFISQYVSPVPEIKGKIGILVSSGEKVPSSWIEKYEKLYEGDYTYVNPLHPELSYYYITENDEVVPMCDINDDEYNMLIGIKTDKFKKYIE